jgi:hypothetical protein
VKDFLPFGDGFKKFLEAALLPAVVAVGLFAFFVYPAIPESQFVERIARLSDLEVGALLGVASLVVAMVATVACPPVQALLEGHHFRRLLAGWKKRHEERWTAIDTALRQGPSGKSNLIQLGQDLRDYPLEKRFVMPTRLGNRMRAAETYGTNRFGLDTPTFYFELRKHAGEQLVADLDRQTLAIDAMVSGLIVLTILAACSAAVALWSFDLAPLMLTLIGVVCSVACYYAAWASAKGYIGAMRALVNEGRLGLVKSLGLRLPDSLADERAFWSDVRGYVFWGPGEPPWPGTAQREERWKAAATREHLEPDALNEAHSIAADGWELLVRGR